MKAYRAVMEWRFYDEYDGGGEYWRLTASVWYASRELAELALEELRDIRTKLILYSSPENTCVPPDGDDAFFDENSEAEFKALRIEENDVFDTYQLKDLPDKFKRFYQ